MNTEFNRAVISSPETDKPLLVSAADLADLLGISVRSLWRLRSAGKLPKPIRLGGTLRWHVLEIERWVEAGCPPLTEWILRCQSVASSLHQ